MGRLAAAAAILAAVAQAVAQSPTVISPNGLIAFVLARDANRRLAYSVSLGGVVAVEPSRAGIVVDGKDLGDGAEIGRAESYVVDETYPWYGVHATAVPDP